jgi:hypothetical protein
MKRSKMCGGWGEHLKTKGHKDGCKMLQIKKEEDQEEITEEE